MRERAACLQWKVEIERSKHEQAEAEVAALELCLQTRKKEGGSKEVRFLIATEAERTQALKHLYLNEAKKNRKWKLHMMQKEMAALIPRSLEALTAQTTKKSDLTQQVEELKHLIVTIEKQLQSRKDQVEMLHEEFDCWQQKYFQLQEAVQEIVSDKHQIQPAETEKVILMEIKKANKWIKGIRVLQDKVISLEAEVRGRAEQYDVLWAQVQKVEVEKGQLEGKMQSIRTL